MVQNTIGLNLGTVKNGTEAATLVPNLDRVRHAGFQGVGLWQNNILQWLQAGLTIQELHDHVTGRNLKVDEICFVEVLKRDGSVADQTNVFRWAKALGAAAVVCLYFRPDHPLDRVRSDWAEFVRTVQDIGVPAAFEFVGPWPQYNSPLQAWEVIQAGPELGTMVFDTFHFWRGGCDLSQIEKIPGNRVSLAHLSDARDVPSQTAVDADRTYPGEGVIPLRQVLTGLVEQGFTGPLSIEILGGAQEQNPATVIKHAYEAARKLVDSL